MLEAVCLSCQLTKPIIWATTDKGTKRQKRPGSCLVGLCRRREVKAVVDGEHVYDGVPAGGARRAACVAAEQIPQCHLINTGRYTNPPLWAGPFVALHHSIMNLT